MSDAIFEEGVPSSPAAKEIPEDLRIFQERMAALGVRVKIPVPGSAYQLPAPIHLDGTPLSEVIIEERRRHRDSRSNTQARTLAEIPMPNANLGDGEEMPDLDTVTQLLVTCLEPQQVSGWLNRANPDMDGRRPIDVLREDGLDERFVLAMGDYLEDVEDIPNLGTVIKLLLTYYQPESILRWFLGRGPDLGGRRPIDVLKEGDLDKVTAVINSQSTGAFW